MKTQKNLVIAIIALMTVFTSWAQSYNDDAYYHPKYAAKKKAATEISNATQNTQVEKVVLRDVDEYNRRGNKSVATVEVSVLDSAEAELYQEFEYSERIRRFHDADFTTHITEDGYLNVYLEDGAELTIIYDDNDWDDYYYSSWMSPWAYDRYYRPYWAYHHHYWAYDYHWHMYHNDWYYWGGFEPWYYSWGYCDPYWGHHHHHGPYYTHHPHHGRHDAWGNPTYYGHAGKRPTAHAQARRDTDPRSAVFNQNYAHAPGKRGASSTVSSSQRGSGSRSSSVGTRPSSGNRQSAVQNDAGTRRGSSAVSNSSGRSSSSYNRGSATGSSSRSSSSATRSGSSSRSSYSGSSYSGSSYSGSSYSGSSYSGSSYSGGSRSSGSSYSGGGSSRSGGGASSGGRR